MSRIFEMPVIIQSLLPMTAARFVVVTMVPRPSQGLGIA